VSEKIDEKCEFL